MELVALRIVIEFMGKADADFGLRLRGRSDAASTHQFTGVHLFRSVQVLNGLQPVLAGALSPFSRAIVV